MARPTGDKKKSKEGGDRLISKNRRASFDYELGSKFEAGLVLIGSEGRSLREHAADLSRAFVGTDGRGGGWGRDLRIPPMKHAAFGHEEKRARKLLLRRDQTDELRASNQREGMTLIVTQCYFKNNRVKIEIAEGRGRKKYDKRQVVKARDAEKEAREAIRARRG